MSNIYYGVVKETYTYMEHTREAYGIVAYADADSDGAVTVVASARDLTNDKSRAERLAKKFNIGNLSIRNFYEAIEDFLAE